MSQQDILWKQTAAKEYDFEMNKAAGPKVSQANHNTT
jgi:hypothetical protein